MIRTFDWKPLYTKALSKTKVAKIKKDFKLSKIAAEVLLKRGLENPQQIKKYLYGKYSDMYNPYLFKDMLKAVQRITEARDHKEKVFIHGDYDADGVISTALVKMMLENMGMTNVEAFVPSRAMGYGLSNEAVKKAVGKGCTLIITCDCGSNEHGPLRTAKRNGADVIVLDHHSYQKRPKVYAFLNPEEECYPFAELCGAGVVFKLIQAMFQSMDSHEYDNTHVSFFPEEYIDLVAVATVADSVPIVDENRIIVKEGLKKLSKTGNTGMRNLLKASGLVGRKMTTEIVGFIIAPKINAPGRISDPNLSLDLLLALDEKKAEELAKEMVRINRKRMEVNKKIRDEAIEIIEKKHKNDCFIVLADNSWNKGVIGIVASTIVETYHKPAVVISNGYGSVRTVPEFTLLEPLRACEDLLDRWGGHPMAAGLKIKKKNVKAFRERINKIASKTLSPNPSPYMNYDAKLKLRDISMKLVEDLEKLEPFGNCNPTPLFIVEDTHIARNRVTKDGQHLQLTIRKENRMSSAIGFWMSQYKSIFVDPAQKFDILFVLERNRQNYEQMVLRDLKEVELNW